MILLDTSVRIDYLKGKNSIATEKIDTILDTQIPFGICVSRNTSGFTR